MQRRKGREHLEEEPERRVDAEARCVLGGQARCRFEEIADAVAGDELRHHREAAAGIALDGANAREALVFEGHRASHALAQRPFERDELGPHCSRSRIRPSSRSNRSVRRTQAVVMA